MGRVYTVHPNNQECFYLRLLLHVVKGPKSFVNLRTVDGQVCETFQEACQQRGLLESDRHWEEAMGEAASTQSPHRLRHLFAIMLTACSISNPSELWHRFKEPLSEDILRRLQQENPDLVLDFNEDIYNQALCLLEDQCLSMAGKRLADVHLLQAVRDQALDSFCSEVMRETSYNVSEMTELVSRSEPVLVADQRAAYDAFLTSVETNSGGIFFLDAPGGTGKTFVLNLILAKVRLARKVALAVASSGIAATLLQGGRTAHSAFKLPLNLALSEVPVCNISRGTGRARLLQQCHLIIWDECTMAHRKALEALNLTLQDLRNSRAVMGGALLILAGDFRQTLPVIPRSTPADEVKACLKASTLWGHVKKLSLSTNMRASLTGDLSSEDFSRQLLTIGDGKM